MFGRKENENEKVKVKVKQGRFLEELGFYRANICCRVESRAQVWKFGLEVF